MLQSPRVKQSRNIDLVQSRQLLLLPVLSPEANNQNQPVLRSTARVVVPRLVHEGIVESGRTEEGQGRAITIWQTRHAACTERTGVFGLNSLCGDPAPHTRQRPGSHRCASPPTCTGVVRWSETAHARAAGAVGALGAD